MIEQIYTYFTIDIIYLWLNIGILPFWFLLVFLPDSKFCKIFVTSIFPIFILGIIDVFLFFKIYKTGFNLLDIFNLYFGLDNLLNLFSEKSYVILFWVHFLAINLFCGSWIVKDYQKFNIPKFLVFIPIVLTYFIGPVGLFVYWFIRIFFSKKINLYD